MDLTKKSIEELVALQKEIESLIIKKQKEKKVELKAQFQKLADDAGLTLDEIMSQKKGRKPAKIKYEKDGNTWSGRGRRPAWVVELTEAGEDIEDYAVK